MSPGNSEFGNPVDDIHRQVEAIDLVPHGELEWGINIAMFLIAAYVKVFVVGAAVSEFVNQPGVAMKVENNRPVYGEQAVKVPV